MAFFRLQNGFPLSKSLKAWLEKFQTIACDECTKKKVKTHDLKALHIVFLAK
jgi:hypothetical protein